jgi:hypothetical protein
MTSMPKLFDRFLVVKQKHVLKIRCGRGGRNFEPGTLLEGCDMVENKKTRLLLT